MKKRRGYLGLPAPTDRETWQTIVDGSYACLAIDSAKQFGLVTGGPKINIRRCEQILERGKAMGITASPHCTEEFIAAIQWDYEQRLAGKKAGG